MNKQCRKELLKLLDIRLKEIFPGIELRKDPLLPTGWRLYRVGLRSAGYGFLIFHSKENENRFTMDIALSRSVSPPSSLRKGPLDALDDGGLYFRINKLWAKDGRDHWWEVGPQATIDDIQNKKPVLWIDPEVSLDAISIAVDAVARALDSYVKPYFESQINKTEPTSQA